VDDRESEYETPVTRLETPADEFVYAGALVGLLCNGKRQVV